jgi:hypothetical protein
MELLGHLEERLAALDDIPSGINTELLQQGYQAAEYLGDAATAEGRVDVLDDPAR